MNYGIVGVGKVGKTVAIKLHSLGLLGWAVDRSGRLGGSAIPTYKSISEIKAPADCVIIATPDGVIGDVAAELSRITALPKYACHLSGATTVEVLSPLSLANVKTFAIHPMQTFGIERDDIFDNIFWGVESSEDGYEIACELIAHLGGNPFKLSREVLANKAAYHLIGVAAANFMQGIIEFSRQLANFSGLEPSKLLPAILKTAFDNSLRSIYANTEVPITGPVARADIATIAKHIDSLKSEKDLQDLYLLETNFLANVLLRSNAISVAQYEAIVKVIADSEAL